MRIIFHGFIAAVMLFFCLCGSSIAQQQNSSVAIVDNPKNFAPKINEQAIKQLVMGEGEVSLADYERFWQAVGVKNSAEKKAAIALISKDFLVFSEFNKALLDCAEIAWLQRQEIKCGKAREIARVVAKNYAVKSNDLQGKVAVQRVLGLEDEVSAVIRASAARGVSLNEKPQYRISSLEEIRKDKMVLNRVIDRTKSFLKTEFGGT